MLSVSIPSNEYLHTGSKEKSRLPLFLPNMAMLLTIVTTIMVLSFYVDGKIDKTITPSTVQSINAAKYDDDFGLVRKLIFETTTPSSTVFPQTELTHLNTLSDNRHHLPIVN